MSQSSHDSDTQPSCDGTTNTSGDGASSAVPDVVDVLPNGTPARREEYKNAAVAYRARGKVNIICDSCADCAPEVMRQLGVEVIEFPFVDSEGEHLDDLWTSREPHDFYEAIRKGERVTTSAVTPGRYYDVFSRAAREGLPTVYLGFTGGLSSSIYAAESAVEMVRNEYPGSISCGTARPCSTRPIRPRVGSTPLSQKKASNRHDVLGVSCANAN